MLSISKINGVAETAFFILKGDNILLRWFTPEIEMDLCGHATLATAYCLNSILNYEEVVIQIEKLANLKHHELLEDLAENIINIIFKNKLVKKINLKLEKLDILKKTKSVGIEVSKTKI